MIFQGEKLTYRELNTYANQFAHYLLSLGVGPETLVGIFLERSLSLIVGILGVLKAGGAYVPLDVSYPIDRLNSMVASTRLPVLVSETRLVDKLPESSAKVVLLDEKSTVDGIGVCETTNTVSNVNPSNLAYIIFTSGSTGEPKGVMLEHIGLVNLILAQREAFSVKAGDRVLQFASIGFDASVSEIFTTLGSGATLFLVPQEILTSPPELTKLLHEERINIVTLPPSLLKLMPSPELPNLKTLVSAGENCTWDIIQKWSSGRRLINAYGPTEATVGPTYYLVDDCYRSVSKESNSVPIGRPIHNIKAFILDDHLRPMPVGVPGELYIAGVGLARGYLNQPGLTQEKFVYHTFGSEEAIRLYRTGDLTRYLPDGNIEFLGRTDNQVKIRGFRVELEEIESILNQHPSVQNAIVISQEDETGDKHLIAHVISEQAETLDVTNLRGFLSSKLPGYMVPSFFKLVTDFPLSESGKVDRDALSSIDGDRIGLATRYIAPQTPYQEILAGIFASTLGTKPIGIDDNFFELGGHSLLVTSLLSKIRKTFQLELDLRDVFKSPTVRELSKVIQREILSESLALSPPVTPQARGDVLPLSFAQRRLWFLDQLLPGNAFYNLPTALRVDGDLNIEALRKSLNQIVHRHETLRTTITLKGDEPVQIIVPSLKITIPLIDLSQENPLEREVKAQQIIIEEAREPFDLEQGPLLRTKILRLTSEEHFILLTMHHIISDGWSMRILIREVTKLYQAFVSGDPAPLPPLPIQYTDYTLWQREWLQGEILEKQQHYWKSQLADSPSSLELPTDRPRPAMLSSRGAHLSFEIPLDLSRAVREYAQLEDATLFMILLSAFQVLLYRYTGQTDISVGTPVANRTRDEIEDLIGFFVNTLVMRGDLSGNSSFNSFLREMKEVTLSAYAHQDLPFEALVEMLRPVRDMSHSPLFQVMFALDNMPLERVTLPGLSLIPLDAESGTTKFDLTLTIHDGLDTLHGSVEYNTDLFDPSTIERFVDHYCVLLESILKAPGKRIDELAILSPNEKNQILIEWNKTRMPFPADICVHQIIEHWVERSPAAVAVTFYSESLTYAELNARANQFAHYLHSLGVGLESLVGICLERTIDLIVSLLGVWKAGGAYVPLDPEYPDERLFYMLSDAKVAVLVTQEDLKTRFTNQNIPIVLIDQDRNLFYEYSQDSPEAPILPTNLAYMIYTSGSTGIPKGVQLAHIGLCNVISNQQSIFGVFPEDRILQFSSLSFDAATFEIVMALGSGAVLCLGKREDLLPGRELIEFMQALKPTIVVFPPSALKVLPDTELPFLRVITVAGEACPAELVEHWANGRQFYNLYGPTEDTIWATFARCEDGKEKPPIGKPIQNHQIYILDKNLEPVPIGVAGELFLGGVGIARGYVDRPGLTADRFIPNPFGHGDRLYRSGDIARYLADGKVDFLGREDDQVKIRGFRIELGEIEVALKQHPDIHEVVLMAHSDDTGEPRLVAYIIHEKERKIDFSTLRDYLAKKLPGYMIPGIFVTLDHLPLLPSGKVDRNALPIPESLQVERESEYVQPRNRLEQILVEMWQKIIRVDQIGIYDNFFELGGDSIRGAVFINQLEEILGESIYVAALFEAQTISKLADYLLQKYPEAVAENFGNIQPDGELEQTASKETKNDYTRLPHPAIVPIQPLGTKTPLFCVHPAGGIVFPYYNLVSYMGYDQPLYGVQYPNAKRMDVKFHRLEDLAVYYCKGLQIVQPHGPYSIAGWSSGGAVAFEMARNLTKHGEEVTFLGIIDFKAPRQSAFLKPPRRGVGKGRMRFGRFHLILRFFRSLPPLIKEFYNLLKVAISFTRDGLFLKFSSPKTLIYSRGSKSDKPPLKDYLKWFWISAMRRSLLAKADIGDVVSRDSDLLLIELPTVSRVIGRVGKDVRMTQRYMPKNYNGDITLFTANIPEEDLADLIDPTMGWQNLTTGEVIVQKIPGNHVAVLKKPYVEPFAHILKGCLDRTARDT